MREVILLVKWGLLIKIVDLKGILTKGFVFFIKCLQRVDFLIFETKGLLFLKMCNIGGFFILLEWIN